VGLVTWLFEWVNPAAGVARGAAIPLMCAPLYSFWASDEAEVAADERTVTGSEAPSSF
jgi:hypothetical protein